MARKPDPIENANDNGKTKTFIHDMSLSRKLTNIKNEPISDPKTVRQATLLEKVLKCGFIGNEDDAKL